MAAPPRMLLLNGGGNEAFVALPTTYDKAVQAAADKFTIPKNDIRLSCAASDMPWIGAYVNSPQVFITDNDSYYYACAQKAVVRLTVINLKAGEATAAAPATGGGAPAKGGAPAGGGGGGAAPAKAEKTAEVSLTCETAAGKTVSMSGTVAGDLANGPPAGQYLGTLTVEDKTAKQKFVGKALGPNDILTKFVIHDQATARLLCRPRSIQPKLDILSRTDTGVEVSYSLTDWQVLTAYPMTSLSSESGQTRIRWFAQVGAGGRVTDLLTGTESSGLFMDILPTSKPAPAAVEPEGPLLPAWPDIRPINAFCLPQSLFIPHIDRILTALGVPVEGRTSMITSWLPSLMRHKNIAYRLLSPAQLEPSISLRIIPPPEVLVRIFVLFRGVPDAEVGEWHDRGLLHAEAGLDWKDAIGWDVNVGDESKFRVIEYAFMEVHN
ncbi:uncharacterized protein MKK02DRAFT_41065 [Dioszegia hungarica]|uniref:Uncharacterized protein n=1 Tax=Dioszegia hungarica TaxID=4972 RepID=A0AA38H257_9TREE|nr:uncharacterized protein MKK02DRAFT_41065 [Dioszegia hungarica]KAI9632755.1 hypothetical protein MKK02DRAFT_41065 [Dioszegia hungarica]